MTKAEIREEAKQMVLRYGPSYVLECGGQVLAESNAYTGPDASPETRTAVLAEAHRQARRVYEFLGYEAPWVAEVPLIQRGDI